MPRPSPANWVLPTAWCANTWYEPCSIAANRWTSSAMTNQTTAIRPTAPFPTDVERDPTHHTAAEWFVRLHGAATSVEDTLAWQRWLNESPSHAEAFARIEEVSQVLRSVPPPALVTASQLAGDRYDGSIPLKDWKEPEAARWRWLPLALAAACTGIVVS